MSENIISVVTVAVVSVVIIICSIGIIIASKFQKRQNKKYKDFINIVNEKGNSTFQVKDYLTKEDINELDNEVDVDKLMLELYETYLTLENKLKAFNTNLDDVLTGPIKDFYINKINNFKEKGYSDIIDGIDLIGYSITEFNKEKLKFRVNINCFSYKTINDKIVSGSNLEKIEQILLLTYKKIDNKWLIESYEKIYEKKLSN